MERPQQNPESKPSAPPRRPAVPAESEAAQQYAVPPRPVIAPQQPASASQPQARSPRRGLLMAGAATGLSLVLAAGGFAAHLGASAVMASSAQTAPYSAAEGSATPSQSGGSIPFSGTPGDGDGNQGGNGGPGGGSGSLGEGSGGRGGGTDGSSGSSSAQTDATPADAKESTGVVLIDTTLGYQGAEAAGTGVVLSSDGLILTNNHVIADSTAITATVATTGKTYKAKVLGSDSTKDVAVLQLEDASGLKPAEIDQGSVKVGADVTAVGNAGGTGELAAADGTVTDLNASVTTTAEESAASETLNSMIEVDADVVPGDSGGALLDSDGEVVGINTAASSGTANITGYAIPIDSALSTAKSIIDGDKTQTNTLGYPAFLGIGVQSDSAGTSSSGAVVSGVYENTPAAETGLSEGDTITSIDSQSVSDPEALSSIIGKHQPGDIVALTWIDSSGQTHSASVTLTEGPAA